MTHKPPGTVKRTSGIGGSDIAAICGLSKYRTPYQVYLEKRGELVEDREDTTRLRFGRRLEKPVADEFAFITGRKLWRERVTQRHPDYKFMLANIDRWQLKCDGTQRGVYEGKTVNYNLRPLWTSGGIPDSYYLQLQWYLAVTGCQFGSFGVLFGLDDFHFFDVARDTSTIGTLMELAIDFWRRVRGIGDPPDYTFGEAGHALAKRLYAKATPKKVILLEGPEFEAKIKRLLSLKAAIKSREAEELDLVTFLQTKMQDAEVATFHGLAKIVWANQSRKAVDIAKLKLEHPAIAEALTKETSSRRFTIKAVDEDLIEEDKSVDQPLVISSGVRMIELGD